MHQLIGRRATSEAASQLIDRIGQRSASICRHSLTSARFALLPGPAGPFLLKDARPRLVYTLMT